MSLHALRDTNSMEGKVSTLHGLPRQPSRQSPFQAPPAYVHTFDPSGPQGLHTGLLSTCQWEVPTLVYGQPRLLSGQRVAPPQGLVET